MMGFGMLGGMFLFWIVLIVLAVLLARGLFHSNQPVGGDHARFRPEKSLNSDTLEVKSTKNNI